MRVNVGEVKEGIEREVSNLNLEEAMSRGVEIASRLSGDKPVYVVYDSRNSIPASSFYWTISTLKPSYNLKLLEVQDFLSMIAPYISRSNLLIFLEDLRYVVQMRDNVRIMENLGVLVTSSREFEERFRGESFTIDNLGEFQSLVLKTVISISSALKLVESESPRRVEKLLWEVKSFNGVVGDMLSYYEGDVESMIRAPDAILASEILRYQAERAYDYKLKIYSWSQTQLLPRNSKIHVWKTSLEDQAYKWFVGESLRRNIEVRVLDFKTDPISAQLYSLVISEFRRRLGERL